MNRPELSSRTSLRKKVEELWRLKLENAHTRYEAASARYKKLLKEIPPGSLPDHAPLARARQAESQALSEYTRVLKIFTDLTLNGQLPREQPDTDGGGG